MSVDPSDTALLEAYDDDPKNEGLLMLTRQKVMP